MKNWLDYRLILPILALSGLLLFAPAPARAMDYVYAPEDCEFQMTFPDEPFTTRRCHPDMPDRCELMTGFTKVYDLAVTMNFYVSCKPAARAYSHYDRELVRTTLIAMAGRSMLDDFETSFDDEGGVKRGAILAAGRSYNDRNDMLYMGQLWVGQHSVMTVEAELIGEPFDETDHDFAKILQSVIAKKWADNPPPLEDADDITPENGASATGSDN